MSKAAHERRLLQVQGESLEGCIVHPDLKYFDLRRPFREWPESVRKLIAEREARRGDT